jgi:hypothetical protein
MGRQSGRGGRENSELPSRSVRFQLARPNVLKPRKNRYYIKLEGSRARHGHERSSQRRRRLTCRDVVVAIADATSSRRVSGDHRADEHGVQPITGIREDNLFLLHDQQPQGRSAVYAGEVDSTLNDSHDNFGQYPISAASQPAPPDLGSRQPSSRTETTDMLPLASPGSTIRHQEFRLLYNDSLPAKFLLAVILVCDFRMLIG